MWNFLNSCKNVCLLLSRASFRQNDDVDDDEWEWGPEVEIFSTIQYLLVVVKLVGNHGKQN